MTSNLGAKLQICPKCQTYDTTKNGTVPSKEGRVQRLRCNHCKHIWTDASFVIKPRVAAQASVQPSKAKLKRSDAHLTKTSPHSSDRRHSNTAETTQAFEPHAFKSALTQHRVLQLDIPLDWSSSGLLDFARSAQQNLTQAAVPFGDPGQAELEWQALSPALKGYIRARQHLDVALLLHLQTVLTPYQPFALSEQYRTSTEQQDQPKAAQMTPKQRNIRPQQQKRHLKATREKLLAPAKRKKDRSAASGGSTPKLETEGSSPAKVSSQAAMDEPDRAQLLEVISEFRTERQAWWQERTRLQNSVHELEQVQTRNTLRLTSVTHEFERLKKQVLEPKTSIQGLTPPAAALETKSTEGPAGGSTTKAKNPDALPTSSSNGRTVPPKYTAREEANLERLASSLMANLVRLEGYRVQPRDLPHVIGEKGPWKPVIEHLMTLGKIERRGDFIGITLTELLRRGLQPSLVKSHEAKRVM